MSWKKMGDEKQNQFGLLLYELKELTSLDWNMQPTSFMRPTLIETNILINHMKTSIIINVKNCKFKD